MTDRTPTTEAGRALLKRVHGKGDLPQWAYEDDRDAILAIEDEARQQDFGALRDAIGTALELHAENRCSDMDELLSAALAVHPAPEEKPR